MLVWPFLAKIPNYPKCKIHLRHLLIDILGSSLAYIATKTYNFDYFIELGHFFTFMFSELGHEKVQQKLTIAQIRQKWVYILQN